MTPLAMASATGFRNAVLGQPLDFTLGTPDGLGGALGIPGFRWRFSGGQPWLGELLADFFWDIELYING